MSFMRKILSFYRSKLDKLSISAKMSIVMTAAVIQILVIFLCINRYYNSYSIYQRVEVASMTYLDSIDNLVENLVDTLDSYSRICFSNASVQEALEKGSDGQINFNLQNDVNNYLDELVANITQIESIYLYSNTELLAFADQEPKHYPKYQRVQDYEWYSDREYGEYYVDFSNDDFSRPDNETEICFRRAVRSTRSFQQIGYMIMIVSTDVLENLLVSDDTKYESIFCLLDEERSMIVMSDPRYRTEMLEIGNDMIDRGETTIIGTMGGQKYMFCILQTDKGYYMDAISVDDAYRKEHSRNLMEIMLIALQAVVTLIGIVVISRWYARPIRTLMESMSALQNGIFQPVEMNSGHYEIRELIRVYNDMVREINLLIERTKEAEQMKGKADLKALTAQINPHFLYNTFDSVKALFVLKRYDDACYMIDALSRFYKINLSKGDDFITIERNLIMLKSYVDIQQMRFVGEFDYIYNVDPDILQWKILKLTLQPLIENAINHGIHGYTKHGIIRLDITRIGERQIRIRLTDNGRGMSEELLTKALAGEGGEHGKSFGLSATLHRLQYCYGERMAWSIESEENQGTAITIDLILEEL